MELSEQPTRTFNPVTIETEETQNEWIWNETSPFYEGSNWRDYLSNGSLIKAIPTDGIVGQASLVYNFLVNQPSNGLLVSGANTALAQIPNSFFVASDRSLPFGWYTKNSTLRIVVPNYDEGTLTRYNFVLKSQKEVLGAQYNQKIVNVGVDFIDFLESQVPFGFIDFINIDELGAWQLGATETVPLEPLKRGSTAALLEDLNAPKTDFLGLLVSGVGIFTGNPILIGGGLVLSFLQGRKNDNNFQPHYMRNPVTNQQFYAATQADHERYEALGYTHD